MIMNKSLEPSRETVRELEVPGALNGLSIAIEQLEAAVSNIGGRVVKAMRNEPLTQPVDINKAMSFSTPLAEDIRRLSCKILTQVDILRSYIDRLEI